MAVRDFTLQMYRRIVRAFAVSHTVQPFNEFVQSSSVPAVCFRHDIDRRVGNAISCARVLSETGLHGTFYFRYPFTFAPKAIRSVADLGHEVGYHYETLSKARGDMRQAVTDFGRELDEFRQLVPVDTACMHGSPLSPYDNRSIWETVQMADFGLLGEPYISLAHAQLTYITDTGRAWNDPTISLRDQLGTNRPRFASSEDLIHAVENGLLAKRVMLTFHPERWNDEVNVWLRDLVLQKVKNFGKRILKRSRR